MVCSSLDPPHIRINVGVLMMVDRLYHHRHHHQALDHQCAAADDARVLHDRITVAYTGVRYVNTPPGP